LHWEKARAPRAKKAGYALSRGKKRSTAWEPVISALARRGPWVAAAFRLQLRIDQSPDPSQRLPLLPWMEKEHRWIWSSVNNLRASLAFECGSARCAGGKWMGHLPVFTKKRCPAHPRQPRFPTARAAGGWWPLWCGADSATARSKFRSGQNSRSALPLRRANVDAIAWPAGEPLDRRLGYVRGRRWPVRARLWCFA